MEDEIKIKKLGIKFIVSLVALGAAIVFTGQPNPVYASEDSVLVDKLDNGSIIEQFGPDTFDIYEYGEKYTLNFSNDGTVQVNGMFYSQESFTLALESQESINESIRKPLTYYLNAFSPIIPVRSNLSITPFASWNSNPPSSGYRAFSSSFVYRPSFGGLYASLAAGSLAQLASFFVISTAQVKGWISGVLSALGVSSAWVTGHEKVWTSTHTSCGAAAQDKYQPTVKSNGYYYDAKTPGGSPIYRYRTYWFTDPSGYPGC